MADLKLYSFFPPDRGARVRWLAHELGLTVEEKPLNFGAGDHRAEAYLKLNPTGFVPAVEYAGEAMFESAAICMALAERHPQAGLLPLPGEAGRNDCLSWTFHMASTFDNACFQVFYPKVLAPDAAQHAAAIERVQPHLAKLDRHLMQHDYLAAGRFTIADIVGGHCLATLKRGAFSLDEYPAIAAYYARISARPAAQSANLFKGFGL